MTAKGCVHRWKVETDFDRDRGGWPATCVHCGRRRIFPLKDDPNAAWRSEPERRPPGLLKRYGG